MSRKSKLREARDRANRAARDAMQAFRETRDNEYRFFAQMHREEADRLTEELQCA